MNQLFDRGGKNSSIFVNFHLFVFCCEVSYLVSSFAQVDLDGGNGVDWVTKMVRYIIHYCYIVKVANFDFVKKTFNLFSSWYSPLVRIDSDAEKARIGLQFVGN